MPKNRILIVTTKDDISLSLFYAPEAAKLIEPYHIFYDSPDGDIQAILKQDFQFIYFRDPFNDVNLPKIIAKKTFATINNNYPDAYIVDGLTAFEDLFFEDKWKQYVMFRQFMPTTKILQSPETLNFEAGYVKKRISSRSKGIIFNRKSFPSDYNPKDYIYQKKLNIKKEYRVFLIGQEIVLPLALKSPKTPSNSVRVIGYEDTIPPEVAAIAKRVYKTTKFDFMGLDIAHTDKKFYLLEVNRSCQFEGYGRVSPVNLAAFFNKYLLNKQTVV